MRITQKLKNKALLCIIIILGENEGYVNYDKKQNNTNNDSPIIGFLFSSVTNLTISFDFGFKCFHELRPSMNVSLITREKMCPL